MTTQASNVASNSSKIASGGVLGTAGGGTSLASPGAAGQVLTSNGTNWISAAVSSGAMKLIGSKTPTANQVSWTGLSGYNTYLMIYTDVAMQTFGVGLPIQFSNNVGTLTTSGYTYGGIICNVGTVQGVGGTPGMQNYGMIAITNQGSSYNVHVSGHAFITGMTSATYVSTHGVCASEGASGSFSSAVNIGTASTGFTITNIGTYGTFTLYGIS